MSGLPFPSAVPSAEELAEQMRASRERLARPLMLENDLRQRLRHELTTLNGLWVTDQPTAYEDALASGCDPEGARDCQRDVTWRLDVSRLLAEVDAALAAPVTLNPAAKD